MTKKQNKLLLVVTGLIIVVSSGFLLSATPSYEAKIKAIVAGPSTSSNTVSDKVAALGADAVPAIAAALLEEEHFPSTYYIALTTIGDKRAVMPLIQFLIKTPCQTDGYVDEDAVQVIIALSKFKDKRAIPVILAIFSNPGQHPRMRLRAAATLANISDGAVLEMVRAFILHQYENRSQYYKNANEGFSQDDMLHALIAANTDETLEILMSFMHYETPNYVAKHIVSYFSTIDTKTITEVLIHVIEHPELHEDNTRFEALEVLANRLHRVESQKLLQYLDEFINQQSEGQFYDDLRSRAKALKQQLKLNVGAT